MARVVGTNGDDVFNYNPLKQDYYGVGGNDTVVIPDRFLDVGVNEFGAFNEDGSIYSYYRVSGISLPGRDGRDVAELYSIESIRFSDGNIRIGDGDPLFDPLFYYEENPDVYAAGLDARQHYYEIGWKEGRDPNEIFDTSGYLQTYRDVAASGINPLDHYRVFGAAEGREVSDRGGLNAYLKLNPDLAAAGVDPLTHYLEFGQYEGFENRLTAFGDFIGANIDGDGFDADFYLWMNPDVAAGSLSARDHYINFGFKEGRRPNLIFDPLDYLQDNPDVAAAGLEPLTHYDQFGRYEGRSVGIPAVGDYDETRPDVAASGLNPIYHYLEFGLFEPFGAEFDAT